MSQPRLLRIYLPRDMRISAEAGDHNFINRVRRAVEQAGYEVRFHSDSRSELTKSAMRRGYSLFHMEDPFHDRALTMRRVYHYPFWAIESSAKRWEWHVANTPFAERGSSAAEKFVRTWRKRLFPDLRQTDGDHVYVPLQGRLSVRRSFQAASPLQMLQETLDRTDRPVIATLHPNEIYSENEEHELTKLARRYDRLTIDIGNMDRWLPSAAYVVTQNSSAAFNGYFFNKPAILYGKVDFHHIALNVLDIGLDDAFEAVENHQPNYSAYIHWFWAKMSINAGRPEAEDQIRAALARAEWPL